MTRDEKLAIVIEAIETQPYDGYYSDEKFSSKADTLKSFVDDTWIGNDREELFKRVANRILNALEKEEDDLPLDAERFRALMRCPRIKIQRSAGFDPVTGERKYPDTPGTVHFGAEFWPLPAKDYDTGAIAAYPDCRPEHTHWGHHALKALADDIIAVEQQTNRKYNPLADYEDMNYKQIDLEFNEVARLISPFLNMKYDWQDIRVASKAFVEKLDELEKEREKWR